ncbi:MAG TPA: hypothetical protein PKA42_00785 [Candidatus Paceibacterota bacterium]|nr:hypothetical protein [Candidatus Paceibacterota bacterium]HMO82678.1 hypothetical protein [Candidatus Paceibacterota bacterium]
MYNKAKNYAFSQPYFRRVLGVTLILLGFLALITPLTPGALIMLVGGLELLGIRLLFIDRLINRLKTKKKE